MVGQPHRLSFHDASAAGAAGGSFPSPGTGSRTVRLRDPADNCYYWSYRDQRTSVLDPTLPSARTPSSSSTSYFRGTGYLATRSAAGGCTRKQTSFSDFLFLPERMTTSLRPQGDFSGGIFDSGGEGDSHHSTVEEHSDGRSKNGGRHSVRRTTAAISEFLDPQLLPLRAACLPIFYLETRSPPPWDQVRELSFFDDNCHYYHQSYVRGNYLLGFTGVSQFFLGEFVIGFLNCVTCAMGLYAVTPEGLQTGGGLLSSIVVVSGLQGALQTLTFLNVIVLTAAEAGAGGSGAAAAAGGAAASAGKGGLLLSPLLKATFLLQPIGSFWVMYAGYQLLKCVRARLFSPLSDLAGQGLMAGASSPEQPASPGAAGQPPTTTFRPFMGSGFHIGVAGSSDEEGGAGAAEKADGPDTLDESATARAQQPVAGDVADEDDLFQAATASASTADAVLQPETAVPAEEERFTGAEKKFSTKTNDVTESEDAENYEVLKSDVETVPVMNS
mmetsp:Transcript_27456/g.69236  ORF Transcript_27456/g.69236 Transcript_27456/m.69236 type:complete len:500 (+) Transcript_27456:108-1607(+)|eukprot:CAMPEP_0178998338 /NCGR_PEP_ID=MMETSP0795-20121207/9461_1 /TAXON_ID=88552 /ORGANISM="Amoebophrya sp., Strain Ameob2" /LENGTH=499 /DNA_ID=CAMNT_0020691013 /DNA_START=48 /DNA_END=1547 /DNA_ORIENTATION=+